jgi:hypothetical protein
MDGIEGMNGSDSKLLFDLDDDGEMSRVGAQVLLYVKCFFDGLHTVYNMLSQSWISR